MLLGFIPSAWAQSQSAFTVYNKKTSVDELQKEEQAEFYEIEKKKYELIERLARTRYLEEFWAKKAAEQKTSAEVAQKNYIDKNVKVSEDEIKETLNRFKDHPQLSKLSDAEKTKQVRDYLKDRETRSLIESIISTAIATKKLQIHYPKPQEPVYSVTVDDKDNVRYGPKDQDIKPLGCAGDKCPITIVEYSEFECPFCARVLPDVKRVLTDYKGKVRWVVRDFPLSFHPRARPAAVAAHCASKQGKYWEMYHKLFDNQQALQDKDLEKYAKELKIFNDKYKSCVKDPKDVMARIDQNMAAGAKLGVTGTPAFFINGRKLSGALPYSEFKRVIDEELKKLPKKAG